MLPSHLQPTVGAAGWRLRCVPASWSLPPRQALLVPFYRWLSEVKSRLSVAQCHGGRCEPGAKWQEPPFQSCSRVEHCPPQDTVHPGSIFSCPCSVRCSCPLLSVPGGTMTL